MTCEDEFVKKRDQAVDIILSLENEEALLKEREMNLDNEILTKAIELKDAAEIEIQKEFDKKAEAIKSEYEHKKYAIYDVTLLVVIYGFVVTMLKLFSSERMRRDIAVIFTNIYTFFREVIRNNSDIIKDTWTLTNHQNNRAGWIILSVFLIILVLAIQLAIATVVLGAVFVFIFWAYSDGKFDFPMVITMLVSMILIVWMADKLVFVNINMVIGWIVLQFVVIVCRGILEHI